MGYPTNSIDTSTSKGKLFLLNNSLDNLNIPNVSDSKKAEPVKNLIAYGLRNPWKTFEYKNLLFIPDVGSSTVEEINIVNLDEISQNVTSLPLFGWPIFEGNLSSEIEYTGLLYWEDNIPSSSIDFAINNICFCNFSKALFSICLTLSLLILYFLLKSSKVDGFSLNLLE